MFIKTSLLNNSQRAWFTRVTDGSEQYSKKQVTKAAKVAKIEGQEKILGKLIAVSSGSNGNIINVKINGASYALTIPVTTGLSNVSGVSIEDMNVAINSGSLSNFAPGTFIEVEIDGTAFTYMVQTGDELTKLTDPTAGAAFKVINNAEGENSAGYKTISFTGTKTLATNPGLVDGTEYNATITIDGGTPDVLSITASSSTNQTFQALIATLQSAIGNKGTVGFYNNKIYVISATKGAGSSVVISEDTTLPAKGLFTNGMSTHTAVLDASTAGSATANINSYVTRLGLALKKLLFSEANTVPLSGSVYLTKAEGDTATQAILQLKSTKTGSESIIKIFNLPIVFPTIMSSNPAVYVGTNDSSTAVLAKLYTKLTDPTDLGARFNVNADGYCEFVTTTTGTGSSVEIVSASSSVALLAFLGFKSTSYDVTTAIAYGSDLNSNLGIFEAYYAGKDGNNITITKNSDRNGYSLSIIFNGQTLETFYNYSLNVSDVNFIGTLINNSTKANKVIIYTPPTGASTIAQFEDGTFNLTGGTSGITNIADVLYIDQMETYKNMELYNFDLMAIGGNSSPSIYAKLVDVCNYRKDCFAIFDAPESVAGKPGGAATGGINETIYWHNGMTENSVKLNSKFVATYFPWVLINTTSEVNTQQWHAPSIVIARAIAGSDATATNKYAAPAGTKRGILPDVLDMAYYISDEDKGRMYDDRIGNNLNPIVYNVRNGFFIDGQKTTQRDLNAYNRINVMRTSLFIKRKIYEIAPDYFWQPITGNLRKQLQAVISNNIMDLLVKNEAIKSNYTVDVSDNLNTSEVIAEKGMIAKIDWYPIKSLEKLKVISIMHDDVVQVSF